MIICGPLFSHLEFVIPSYMLSWVFAIWSCPFGPNFAISGSSLLTEIAKFGPKGQDQMAKTHESIYEGITNSKWLNRGPQIINYNI